MEIRLEVQMGIGRGLIHISAIGGVSIPEVLNELETEPGKSKILAYF